MILFVNACVRTESRTKRLADRLMERMEGTVKEIKLKDIDFPRVDNAFITRRTELTECGDYSDPVFDLAKDFAAADTIVIAAPFWDLSFPALLKQYLEQICVTGITFYYGDEGVPMGLCKARELYYVSTAGGPFYEEWGYGYVKTMAEVFFGIGHTERIVAEGLDVPGADVESILRQAEESMPV